MKVEIGGVTIYTGDCLDVLRALPDCSVDALVTDPPAGIGFMGAEWDRDKGGRDAWIAWLCEVMREALRVLKPGAHGLVWALPRTSHWTATALENAGFEVRDCINHVFGQGFPKSLDVSKALDKAAGAKREIVGENPRAKQQTPKQGTNTFDDFRGVGPITAPATEAAKAWQGWGTALKPAVEHWWLVRKPLAGTVAANVAAWGVGAINVDGCRVGTGDQLVRPSIARHGNNTYGRGLGLGTQIEPGGRWPANLVLSHSPGCVRTGEKETKSPVINRFVDGAKPFGGGAGHAYVSSGGAPEIVPVYECAEGCAVAALDRASGERVSGARSAGVRLGIGYQGVKHGDGGPALEASTGGASRFFNVFEPIAYSAKVSTRERNEAGPNTHPTVKPQSLMRHLVRLVTPPCGVVLDPFAGSGSTLVACVAEGMSAIGVECDEGYAKTAENRVRHAVEKKEIDAPTSSAGDRNERARSGQRG